jgi:CHAT domain-containing protein
MLSAESALIEYNIAQGGNAYAFIITKNDFKMVKLDANQADIHLNGDNLRRTLSDYEFLKKQPDLAKAQFIASASFFYDKFLRKALSDSKNIKTLIIVPDKELGHLPFEVFLKNKPQQALGYAKFDYLLNDYAVTYSFSATQLIEKKAQDLKSKPQKRGVLAFAGDYREENKQIAAAENRSAGVRALRQNLQPLPGAEEEVAEMRKYMYGEFFNGKEAGEQIFKDKAKDYNIIHLAMHGLLDTKEPILSSLAFSEDGKADEDNFLYSYEITQLDLSARLVVLSACETGYGKFNQGEGVMSLAHSFMYAGASSVLVSLWQVNDRSTGEIMRYYYFNLAKGMTKGDALQKAKQEYLQKAEDTFTQPAFWAAFVQLGDTVPLELVCKAGYTKTETMTLVAAIAGGLLLLGGAIWWLRRARK